MKKQRFRFRAKQNSDFCNAIIKGKCCFKKVNKEGLCKDHLELFTYLADGAEITPKSSFCIEYQPNIGAKTDECKVIEMDETALEKFTICKGEAFKKGLCKRHFKILEKTELVDAFIRTTQE